MSNNRKAVRETLKNKTKDIHVDANETYEEILKRNKYECCICSKEYYGFGNNPYPLSADTKHRCCDACNSIYVIPARIVLYTYNKETK